MMARIDAPQQRRTTARPALSLAPRLMLLAAALALSGCQAVGFVAQGVEEVAPPPRVEAEYKGLKGQRVAVLVDADLGIMFEHPQAQVEVCQALSERLAAKVPNVTVRQAQDVIAFQNENIYWNTATYSELADRLNVNRLVLVELTEYRLHEPGNVNIWQGAMQGRIAVAETDGQTPDDRDYATMISAKYPPDKPLGAIDADQQVIRKATLDIFTRRAVNKFHEHTEERS